MLNTDGVITPGTVFSTVPQASRQEDIQEEGTENE